MACGSVAMTYVTDATDGLYPNRPPIINTHHTVDIADKLYMLADNEEYCNRLGKEGREWVLRNCSPEVSVPQHIKFLERVLNE